MPHDFKNMVHVVRSLRIKFADYIDERLSFNLVIQYAHLR